MAPVTEVSPMINTLEVADDKMANLSSSGKPPRNLSAMRHCNSTAWLTDSVGSSLLCSFFVLFSSKDHRCNCGIANKYNVSRSDVNPFDRIW